jgi:hypothetical protein
MPECREKVSPALAFLLVVNFLNPASAFRASPVLLVADQSGIAQLSSNGLHPFNCLRFSYMIPVFQRV